MGDHLSLFNSQDYHEAFLLPGDYTIPEASKLLLQGDDLLLHGLHPGLQHLVPLNLQQVEDGELPPSHLVHQGKEKEQQGKEAPKHLGISVKVNGSFNFLSG